MDNSLNQMIMKQKLIISAEQEDPCLDYSALNLQHLELDTQVFFDGEEGIPEIGVQIYSKRAFLNKNKFVGKGTHYIGNEQHIGINSDGVVVGIDCE